MKKLALMTLALVAIVASGVRAAAPSATELKPVIVVAFGGYDSLKSDINFIGELGGKEDTAAGIEIILDLVTMGQGAAGLDKTRPWGAVVSTDGEEMKVVGLLPVTDLKKMMGLLEGFQVTTTEGNDGEWELSVPNSQMPIHVKEREGWAYISERVENLSLPIGKPDAILGDISKQYDFGVRVNVQNVPKEWRDMAIGQMREGMEMSFENEDEEDAEVLAARKKMAETQIAQIEKLFNEVDQLLLGFQVDEKEKNAKFGATVTVKAGTDMAKQLAATTNMKSLLSGFHRDGELMSVHTSTSIPQEQVDQAMEGLEQSFMAIEQQIEKEEDEDKKQLAKDFLAAVKKTTEATLRKGHANMGWVITGEGPFTFVGGAVIAEGKSLEAAIKKGITAMQEKAKDDGEEVEVEFDSEQYKGLNFHTISFELPDGDDQEDVVGRAILGEEGVITLAFSEDRAFVAVGEEGADEIKKVIDSSASAKVLPLADGYISILPILEFVHENAEDFEVENAEMLEAIIDNLEENGKDKVRFETTLIPNGEKFSLVFEEGLLRTVGEAGKLAAPAAPGF